jgi:hypothetical protein
VPQPLFPDEYRIKGGDGIGFSTSEDESSTSSAGTPITSPVLPSTPKGTTPTPQSPTTDTTTAPAIILLGHLKRARKTSPAEQDPLEGNPYSLYIINEKTFPASRNAEQNFRTRNGN